MFRSVVGLPRTLQQAGRLVRVGGSRGLCSRGSRNAPVWRRRSLFDDILGDAHHHRPSPLTPWAWGPFTRMMDEKLQRMDKLMDNVMGRRWQPFEYTRTGGREVEVKYNDKEYEVKVDVTAFSPEDLHVKLTGNKVQIAAKHQERADDHGYISREFTRQFIVPEDVELESVESLLTNDGYLVVRGHVRGSETQQERVLEINKEQEPDKDSK